MVFKRKKSDHAVHNLRVILKCNGEFIYTPPLYLCFAAEKRPPPPGLGVSAASVGPPPSRVSVGCTLQVLYSLLYLSLSL